MKRRGFTFASIIVGGLSVAGATALLPMHSACAQRSKMSYKQDIAPIFRGWCVSCHHPGGEGYKASGVDLRTYAGLMKGTKYGTVVEAGNPDGSTLIALIFGRTSKKIRMPYGHKPLPDCLRNNIWEWIFEGAKDN